MKRSSLSLLVGTIVPVFLSSLSAAPPVARSIHYDGVRADVQTYASHPLMNSNVAMTVEAWVYREDDTRCETILSHDYRSSFWLGFCSRLSFYRSGGTAANADRGVPARQWTHVAASYDGARVRFYINGDAAGNVVLGNSGAGPANQLSLGGVPEVNSYYFYGNLDEVRLWNVARTQSQIRSNLYQQLMNTGTNIIPGLIASFPLGGGTETYRGWSSLTALAPSRIGGFGILPSNLVIPRSATFNFDGTPDLSFEFGGAEQMVIRYNDGANAPDAVVYLVYRDVGTDRYLYLGTSCLREPVGRTWEESYFEVYIDPNGSGGASRSTGDYYVYNSIGGGAASGFVFSPPALFTPATNRWQHVNTFCNGEFVPPCREVRIHKSFLNNFTNPIGLMLRHAQITNSTDGAPAPGNASTTAPGTWARAAFGGAADVGLATVSVSGTATNIFGGGISNRTVRLYSGSDTLTGIFVAERTTSASGAFSFAGVPVLADEGVTLNLEAKLDYATVEPQWASATGAAPVATNHAAEVVYAPCASSCALRSINFRVLPPPGALMLASFSPTSGVRTVTVRTTPPRVYAGDVVRIVGSNLHERINVFFSRCQLFPPDSCVEGAQIFRVQVMTNDPARLWVDVVVPELPANDSYRLLVQDNWIGHPGWTEWRTAAGGQFHVREQIYPKLWGFEWANDGDGPGLEDFEAAYGDNIFTIVPFPPFKVRDPYYFTFWYPLYLAMGAASSDGNCHGIAGVSRMFERGDLHVADCDAASSCGPSGVRFPNGFRGRNVTTTDGMEYQPCKPSAWTGFDLFQSFRPRNLWAVIRQNMMAQLSEEGIQNILNQTTFDGGNPLAVLGRVRSAPAGYVLCFQPAGGVTGHCITPYAVQDGLRLTDDLLNVTSVAASNFSIIRLYDNNWPNRERHMEIDRSANQFRYLLGYRDGDIAQPTIWSGRSLYSVPMSFYTSGRHAPGPWNLAMPDRLLRLIFSGGADAQHTNSAGEVWGWNAAGDFSANYRGAGSFFPFALGDYSNRVTRSGFAFLPETNPPTGTIIHVRSNHYIFQAAQGSLAVQFIASNAVPGTTDGATLIHSNSTLAGLRFCPQAGGAVMPMLAQPHAGGGSAVFVIIGLNLPAGNDISVIGTEVIGEDSSRVGKKGLMLINGGGADLNYSLKLESVDGASGAIHNYIYGPFDTPAGAAHRLSFPDWPQAQQVASEMDFGADGIFEQSTSLAADYVLSASREPDGIALRWRSSSPTDVLEATDGLGPGAKWGTVNATRQLVGNERTVKLPPASQNRFFRVRP